MFTATRMPRPRYRSSAPSLPAIYTIWSTSRTIGSFLRSRRIVPARSTMEPKQPDFGDAHLQLIEPTSPHIPDRAYAPSRNRITILEGAPASKIHFLHRRDRSLCYRRRERSLSRFDTLRTKAILLNPYVAADSRRRRSIFASRSRATPNASEFP